MKHRLRKTKEAFLNTARKLDCFVFDRIGPIKALFLVHDLRGFQQMQPLIAALLARGVAVRISLIDTATIESYHLNQIDHQLTKLFIPVRLGRLKKWHYIFQSEVTFFYPARFATRVQLSHGSGWGNLTTYPCNTLKTIQRQSSISISVLYSNAHLEYFKQHDEQLTKKQDFLCVIGGSPKLDALKPLSRTAIASLRSSLGMQDIITVAVTSHWRPKSILPRFGENLIDAITTEFSQPVQIVILGHEKLWEENEEQIQAQKQSSLAERIAGKVALTANTFFIRDPKQQRDYLRASDIVVHDNSSVLIECLCLEKSTVFLRTPETMPIEPTIADVYIRAGQCFSSLSDLPNAISRALINPSERRSIQRDMLALMVSRRGNSADFLADLVVKIGRVSGPKSHGWAKARKLIAFANAELDHQNAQA
ncbi:hypothetical protein R0137_06885 [Congregibacter brevis]|uniref:CDP-Glycerol:Poly(Glycerophosphate) glycerophosphotransferase n=1 Tax=Congregibacter brevis TaxID=3081201 RepID=A0ABZ0IHX4_9GAMM|nr:hypothetical protein R0137_06885 [Congregibacter sp. IMCC45268]